MSVCIVNSRILILVQSYTMIDDSDSSIIIIL